MIVLKTEEELAMLRKSGKILAKIMARLKQFIRPGISTQDIDRFAEELLQQENVISAFKGYRGFPANICTSVNEEIIHGIPGPRQLKDTDIISIDLGINYQGYFSDAAITIAMERASSNLKRLVEVTKQALFEGIKQARVNNYLSDISHAIQNYVERNGFSVVREFVGHGIGRALHEEPEVPNFGLPHRGPILKSGMVLAIEPMVNMGSWESRILANGWTAVTKDGLASAHFEHTVAIREDGP
ncbi:MAG: type I methionyl aminopeptidase, partial [Candidatus Omnitrophica bacterium]|nr:type I methionyl aminopeptidase [Candidatus Omnitrophota bacterium]